MPEKIENIRKWFLFAVAFVAVFSGVGGNMIGYNQALKLEEALEKNTAFRIKHETKHEVHDEYNLLKNSIKAPHE